MAIRIEEAIKLRNLRNQEENIKNEKPARDGVLKKQDIAEKLWPGSEYAHRMNSFSSLLKGRSKKVNPEWVDIICDMCGVDANFIMGQPSQFDDEFKKLTNAEEKDNRQNDGPKNRGRKKRQAV